MADLGWGRLQLVWEGWDGSSWTISDPTQQFIEKIVTTFVPGKNKVDNSDMAIAGANTAVRTNLQLNPLVQNNLNDISADAGPGGVATFARQTGQTGWWFASTSARATWTTASTAVAGGIMFNRTYLPVANMEKRPFATFLQVRCSKVQRLKVQLNWYNNVDAFIATTTSNIGVVAANTVTTLAGNHTAPTGAARVDCFVYSEVGTSGTVWAVGNWLEATHFAFEESDQVLQYDAPLGQAATVFKLPIMGDFNANTVGMGETYGWDGAQGNSISRMYLPSITGWNPGGSGGPRLAQIPVGSLLAPATAPPVPGITKLAAVFLSGIGGAASGNGFAFASLTGLKPGVKYTASGYVYGETGKSGSALYGTVNTGGSWFDSTATPLKDQWIRVSVTFTAAGDGAASIYFVSPDQLVTGDDRFFVTGVQLEEGLTASTWEKKVMVQVDTKQPREPVINSGVFIPREGVRGLSMPPITRYSSDSPAVAGSRHRGHRVASREVFWPVMVASDESTAVFKARDRAFFKTMRPDRQGTWKVIQPDGETRSLKLRFLDDGDATHDFDPMFFGTAVYGLKLVADQPFWEGQPITRRWGQVVTNPGMFAGPGVINIGKGQTIDSASIDNPGDVEGWMVWTIAGAFTSAEVGVDGSLIEVPFALAADRKLVIDTRPDRLTAYEYAVTDTALTGAYIDRTDDLGDVVFGAVPDGAAVPLSIVVNGAGASAYATGTLTPLFYRAW